MKKARKIIVQNKSITLTDKEYRAQGGEGSIYQKGNIAYKIYHDPANTIPEAKIHELNTLTLPNVLNPKDVIYDVKHKPIGYTIGFVTNTEYLKRIFVKTFRDKNGITTQDVHDLNGKLQDTLVNIHKAKFVVADFNEMNVLIGDNYTNPYIIDVDSWQTPNFKATAIMETVRDVTVPLGQFNRLTDWYSWAIITFQLYTGLHPYRDGRHPKIKPKDWTQRVEKKISVFDKDVTVPKFASDFSMIPTNLLDWYKHIFVKGKRDLPPIIGTLTVGQIQSTIIVSHGNFIINKLKQYNDAIRSIYYYDGIRYVITNKSIYKGDNVNMQFQTMIKGYDAELAKCIDDDPILGYQCNKNIVKFVTLNKDEVGTIVANGMMEYNGAIYTIHNNQLYENSFEKFGKIIHKTKSLCNIYESAYKMYKGVVIQDILGKCWLAVPFEMGKCTNIHIPDLDSTKIIDAKHDHGICIVLYEKNKKYYRTIIYFNSTYDKYEIETNETTCSSVNIVRLPNKICAMAETDKLVLFSNNKQKKEIGDPPFNYDMTLYSEHMQVQFVDNNTLYSIKMK